MELNDNCSTLNSVIESIRIRESAPPTEISFIQLWRNVTVAVLTCSGWQKCEIFGEKVKEYRTLSGSESRYYDTFAREYSVVTIYTP